MSNGKGSSRREFDKKRERTFKERFTETYPERKKCKPGKTTFVVGPDGGLVEKNPGLLFIGIDPAFESGITPYSELKEYQLRLMRSLFVPPEVLGVDS